MNIRLQTDCKDNKYIILDSITHMGVSTPKNFKSDGLTKGYNKYQPRGMRGAGWHDWCCVSKCIPWAMAARGARELWKQDGVSWFTRNKWYSGVRLWGWVSFKKGAYK